jgi:hypothetical protein
MTRDRLFFMLRIAVWVVVAGCVFVFARKLDRDPPSTSRTICRTRWG